MKKMLLAVGLVAATTMSANAALITTEASFGTQGSPFDVDDVSPLEQVLMLDVFDQSLGTLNDVSIRVFGQIDTEGTSTNFSNAAGRTDIEVFLTADWLVSSSVADDFLFASANSTTALFADQSSAPNVFTQLPGTDSAAFSFDLSTGELSGLLTNIDVSAFLGDSPIEFIFSTDARTNLFNQVQAGTGQFMNSFSTGSFGRIVAEFDFTPAASVAVSEPGAMSLAAFGIFLIAVSRRKFQSQYRNL